GNRRHRLRPPRQSIVRATLLAPSVLERSWAALMTAKVFRELVPFLIPCDYKKTQKGRHRWKSAAHRSSCAFSVCLRPAELGPFTLVPLAILTSCCGEQERSR